jgi:hypothetical protein
MAQILQDFGQELESEKLKNAQTNYKIPENCPSMGVPLTNTEIRKCLDSVTKSMDVSTFARFYRKDVTDESRNLGQAIMDRYVVKK